MATGIDAYPLSWPKGRPRNPNPASSRFGRKSWGADGWGKNSLTTGRARDAMLLELDRIGATDIIVSTNMPVRNDGMFYATAKEPDDPGVAVYFQLKGRPMVFACDQWETLKENAWAIAKTIEALRGVERWGSGDMLERAFTGFMALPMPETKKHWKEILGFQGTTIKITIKEVRERVRYLSFKNHPDRGGDTNEMAEINRAAREAADDLEKGP